MNEIKIGACLTVLTLLLLAALNSGKPTFVHASDISVESTRN